MGFIIAVLACLAVGGNSQQLANEVGTGNKTVVVTAPADAVTRYFILDRDVGNGKSEAYGTARFVRWGIATGGERLELETRLLSSQLVISHVERIEPKRRTLSWRERSPAGVRSLFLQGTTELRGWVGNGNNSRQLTVEPGSSLPLEWLALMLRGEVHDHARIFDPLRLGLRELDVSHTQTEDADRWLWREAGYAREEWRISSRGLEGFDWRSGRVHARRVSQAEFQRLSGSQRKLPRSSDVRTSRKP